MVDRKLKPSGKGKGNGDKYQVIQGMNPQALIAECLDFGGMVCPLFQTLGYAFKERVSGNFMAHSSADGDDFNVLTFMNGIIQGVDETDFVDTVNDVSFSTICCMESFNHDGEGDTR